MIYRTFAAIVISMFIASLYLAVYKVPVKVEEPKAQRYRFDVVCPDGSHVGYVSTHRLPKSTLCQPDPQ